MPPVLIPLLIQNYVWKGKIGERYQNVFPFDRDDKK